MTGSHYESFESRRRRFMRATQVQPFTLLDIIERDGLICYLCQRPVEREDATLDHVQPLSRGGVHTPLNARVAHRSCNSRKGKKLLTEL